MRIRSTKPEFYRSKTIGELSWSDRHVLKALESYVDDNGVGKDDVALFAADAFPRDMFRNAPETLRSLSEALERFHDLHLIVRYQSDGEDLLYIDRWAERQRIDKPTRGRFRRPDGTLEYAEAVNREAYRNPPEDCRNPPEIFAPGTGEQGNRGTGENTPSSTDVDGDFAEWYDLYPRKVGKQAAIKAYRRARKVADADTLLAGLRSQLPKLAGSEERFRPHPATWLNEGRWEDEPASQAAIAVDAQGRILLPPPPKGVFEQ